MEHRTAGRSLKPHIVAQEFFDYMRGLLSVVGALLHK